MNKKGPIKGDDLEGNAWTFSTIESARTVYQTMLKKPGFLTRKKDSSLVTGFFAGLPTLIFLWGPSVDPEIVKSVEVLASIAGGKELATELKVEALRQMRLRWRAQRSKRPFGGTLVQYHPQGKVWTDLRD